MAAIDPDSPRYARQRVLPGWGADAQRRLADAHVVVLGAGGLGSAVVPALVAAGVGRVTVVDDDRVEVTNLHRQTLHAPVDVGRPKVESAADAAAALSPETTFVPVTARFDAGNADELLAEADLVIDGTDDILTRYVADDAAARAGIPLVWGSAAKFSGQVGVSWEARGVSYRDLFPEPPADAGLSCEIDGILPDRVHRHRRHDGGRGAEAAHRRGGAAARSGRGLRRAVGPQPRDRLPTGRSAG